LHKKISQLQYRGLGRHGEGVSDGFLWTVLNRGNEVDKEALAGRSIFLTAACTYALRGSVACYRFFLPLSKTFLTGSVGG